MSITLDTNLLIYASGFGPDRKVERALEILAGWFSLPSNVLLLQTLGEFSHVALRKYGLSPLEVSMLLQAWSSVLTPRHSAPQDVFTALSMMERHAISFGMECFGQPPTASVCSIF